MSDRVDVHPGPFTVECLHSRADYHVHVSATPGGAWVSIDTPGITWGEGFPFGRWPRRVGLRDWWWNRIRGVDRSLDERLVALVAETVLFIRRRIGDVLTPEELAGKLAAERAVARLSEDADG